MTVAALLAAFFVACYDQINTARREGSPPPVENPTEGSDRQRYHDREFFVTNVVDGDTLDIDALDGNKLTTRVRLIGVDTPETKKPGTPVMYYGPEASEFTRSAADGKLVTIWLDAAGGTRDRYGRLLAYVRLPDGRVLNEAYQKYVQLEASAMRNERGLWRDVRREQLPDWLQKKKPKLLN
jgi:endonuclease YncB( thermonuclease family)